MNAHHGVNQTSVVALWFAFSPTPLTLTSQDGDETCTIFSPPPSVLFFLRSCLCYVFLFVSACSINSTSKGLFYLTRLHH